ncbi:MAG: hypothetical protein ACOC0H_07500, partial [Thermodesulfobacteriota bacterium]
MNRLKVHIAVQLIFLLGISMFLVNVVLIMLVQKSLLKSETARGALFLSSLEYRLSGETEGDRLFKNEAFKTKTASFVSDGGISALLVVNEDRETLFLDAAGGVPEQEMIWVTRKAVGAERQIQHHYGSTWGIFWTQPEYLILAAPRRVEGQIRGGMCIVLPLRSIYEQLRYFQQILIVYILINTLIFTLIGLYRLSKTTVRPLHNLLERAESYQGDEDIFFLDEKRENEFSQLSR